MSGDDPHPVNRKAELAALYSAELVRLLRYLRHRLPDDGVAEEVAQETWRAIISGWDKLRTHPEPTNLLYRVARCRAANWHRDHGSKAPRLHYAVDQVANVVVAQDLVDAVVPRADLTLALADLPTRQREAIYLRYVDDLSLAQVGDQMGISTEGAKKAIARGLSSLRRSSHLASYAAERSRPEVQ